MQRGRKREFDNDIVEDTRPTQRLRTRRCKLALAAELLLPPSQDEYYASRVSQSKGVKIPKSYKEAINDPIHGSKWRESIHFEISTLMKFGTWRAVRRKDVVNQGSNIATT